MTKPRLILIIGIAFLFNCFNQNVTAQIKINAVGDIMLGSVTPKKILPPEKGKVFVKSAKDLLAEADIVFGNLEGTFITDDMEPKKCSERSRKRANCYEFGMPDYLAPVLMELGFNVLNQDNNHSEDYGYAGYRFTQEKLKQLGIKFIPKQGYNEFEVDSANIGIVAFGYSGNSNNISDLENAKNIIGELSKRFDILIVSFHGGAEGKDAAHLMDTTETFLGEDRGNVYQFAHTVIDAGADMVIGHGPHVLRAMEIYKNKLIVYSLGNFLTYGNMNLSGVNSITVILKAEIGPNNGNFIRGKLISVKQIGNGIPIPDETNEGFNLIKSLTQEDIPNAHLLFLKNDRIYPTEIITPAIKPIELNNEFKLVQIKKANRYNN